MGYKELARSIRNGHHSLKKEADSKCCNITWDHEFGVAEISVENGAVRNLKQYLSAIREICLNQEEIYLFCTNDKKTSFLSIKEIMW